MGTPAGVPLAAADYDLLSGFYDRLMSDSSLRSKQVMRCIERTHAAEELRPGAADASRERRYRRGHRAGRVRFADLRWGRQRLRESVRDRHPARGHLSSGRARHERRLPARLAGRHLAAVDPFEQSFFCLFFDPSGGSYTGTLTAPQSGTYVLALTNPCACYTATSLSLSDMTRQAGVSTTVS